MAKNAYFRLGLTRVILGNSIKNDAKNANFIKKLAQKNADRILSIWLRFILP